MGRVFADGRGARVSVQKRWSVNKGSFRSQGGMLARTAERSEALYYLHLGTQLTNAYTSHRLETHANNRNITHATSQHTKNSQTQSHKHCDWTKNNLVTAAVWWTRQLGFQILSLMVLTCRRTVWRSCILHVMCVVLLPTRYTCQLRDSFHTAALRELEVHLDDETDHSPFVHLMYFL